MPTAAAPITVVANQPTVLRTGGSVNPPITAGLQARRIIMTMTGTATTPLITALQNSALIGSRATTFRTAPAAVRAAIVR